MTASRLALAIGFGLVLAASPFLRYAPLGHSGEPHADHEPRHGGQLGMVGDFHLELVPGREVVEVFVSDAVRRPLRPRAGRLLFDRSTPRDLRWERYRLVGAPVAGARSVQAAVTLDDGTELSLEFDLDADLAMEPIRR